MKQKDRDRIVRDFLTHLMGQLSSIRLGLEMFLEDKRFLKPEAAKIRRKKRVPTK